MQVDNQKKKAKHTHHFCMFDKCIVVYLVLRNVLNLGIIYSKLRS